MAITNAQQFKQLVNPPMEGKKRPGYRGEAAAASDKAGNRDAGRDTSAAGTSDRGDGPASRDFGGPGRDERMGMKGKTRPGRNPMAQFGGIQPPPAYDEDGTSTRNFNFMKDARRRVNPFGILTDLPGIIGMGARFLTPNPFGFGPKPFDAQGFGSGESGGPQDIPYWAKLGFSSEEEYLASLNKDEEPEYVNPLSKLSSRIGGSRFAAAGGGIASLEDMDREAFLLGGVAKGLKKAVRGIKKLAKSPIGKAALLYAGGSYLSGKGLFGNLKGAGFLKTAPATIKAQAAAAGLSPREFMMGIGGKTPQGPGGILGFIQKNPILSIFGASAAAGLSADEDKNKFDIDSYYASNKLNPSLSTRMMGSDFDFYGGQTAADGGRIGYQEGGDAEPVAKKTMPLLDMDGKEMDLREDGGFVPIGRMEKADDVPARLSKNEFVFTADAVRNAGDGDVDKGAEVMYNMMKNLEAGGEVSEESQGLEGARKMFQTSQRLEEVL